MQKDLKIGLILGLAIVSVAGLWLATRPSLTPQARLRGEAVPALSPAGNLPAAGNKGKPVPSAVEGMPSPRATSDENTRRSSTVSPLSPETRAPIRRAVVEGTIESNRLATPAMHVQPETIKPQRFHIVRQGETLSEISYDYYGSAGKWRKIFEANRSTVKNANVVKAGTKLIIPD